MLRGKWKAQGQCSKGDSCSFSQDPLLASGNRSSNGQRREGLSSSSKAKQADGEKGDKEDNSDKRSQILCRYETCNYPSCKCWHLPVCLDCKSEKGCVCGDKCRFRHVEADGKPNKKSTKGGAKRSVAIVKESTQLGCVSQDFYQRKSILRDPGKLGTKHAVTFS